MLTTLRHVTVQAWSGPCKWRVVGFRRPMPGAGTIQSMNQLQQSISVTWVDTPTGHNCAAFFRCQIARTSSLLFFALLPFALGVVKLNDLVFCALLFYDPNGNRAS